MKGWQVRKIGEVCKVIAGQSPEGKHYNDAGEGLPFYQGKKDFGDKFIKTPRVWTREITKEAEAGDILMSVRAPVGPINFSTTKICIGRGLAAIRTLKSIDREFLFYMLLSKQGEISGNEGAVFASINKSQIEAITVAVPAMPEQRRIVAILDEAFAGLEAMRANAEKNHQNARDLFDSYLNAIFMKKGEGWKTETLNRHVQFIDYRGKTPPKRDVGVRLITAKNVKMGFIRREPEEFIDPSAYDSWMTRGFPERGDVLFTTEAPLGNVAQLDTDEKVVIGQRLITMKPDQAVIDRSFLAFMLMSKPLQDSIHAHATGATVLGIKAKLLKDVPIYFPTSISHQRRIASEISQIAEEASRLEFIYRQKLAAIAELKQSILQKAFSAQLTSAETIAA